MLVFAIKKNKPFVLVFYGVVLLAAGWVFYSKGTKMSYALFAMAILFAANGIDKFIRRSIKVQRTQSKNLTAG